MSEDHTGLSGLQHMKQLTAERNAPFGFQIIWCFPSLTMTCSGRSVAGSGRRQRAGPDEALTGSGGVTAADAAGVGALATAPVRSGDAPSRRRSPRSRPQGFIWQVRSLFTTPSCVSARTGAPAAPVKPRLFPD